ncbi:MAG: hypothetical protein AAFR61_15205 [Bacteroidota bacterium]
MISKLKKALKTPKTLFLAALLAAPALALATPGHLTPEILPYLLVSILVALPIGFLLLKLGSRGFWLAFLPLLLTGCQSTQPTNAFLFAGFAVGGLLIVKWLIDTMGKANFFIGLVILALIIWKYGPSFSRPTPPPAHTPETLAPGSFVPRESRQRPPAPQACHCLGDLNPNYNDSLAYYEKAYDTGWERVQTGPGPEYCLLSDSQFNPCFRN